MKTKKLFITYNSPAEWAELNLSPDEIKDILNGEELIGLILKRRKTNENKILFFINRLAPSSLEGKAGQFYC